MLKKLSLPALPRILSNKSGRRPYIMDLPNQVGNDTNTSWPLQLPLLAYLSTEDLAKKRGWSLLIKYTWCPSSSIFKSSLTRILYLIMSARGRKQLFRQESYFVATTWFWGIVTYCEAIRHQSSLAKVGDFWDKSCIGISLDPWVLIISNR